MRFRVRTRIGRPGTPIRYAISLPSWPVHAGPGDSMRLADLVTTSRRVSETRSRLEKISALGNLLRRLAPEEIDIAVAFLSGQLRQGRIGLGGAVIRSS